MKSKLFAVLAALVSSSSLALLHLHRLLKPLVRVVVAWLPSVLVLPLVWLHWVLHSVKAVRVLLHSKALLATHRLLARSRPQ